MRLLHAAGRHRLSLPAGGFSDSAMELARLLAADGRDLARVELATSPWVRARGLLGRSGLAPGRGLWLAPCRAVHTVGMRFAIDVVFLDRESRVAAVCKAVAPCRLAWGGWRARGALEFAAGEATRLGLAPGQQLRLLPNGGTGEVRSARTSAL